jgi:hypothetical protein
MRVIPPLTMLDSMLLSSTADEVAVGESLWSSGVTYGLGDRASIGAPSSAVSITVGSAAVVSWAAHGLAEATIVVFSTTGSLPTGLVAGAPYYVRDPTANAFQLSTKPGGPPVVTSGMQSGTHTATAQVHRVYESLQADNANHPPAIDDSAEWWGDLGPTNRWAMFDLLRNTGTAVPTPLVVTIKPNNRIDSIALVGLIASEVQITMSDGTGTIYSSTDVLNLRTVATWSDYFFDELSFRESVIHFDLPVSPGATVTVTISNPTGNVNCGALLMGAFVDLGETVHDPVSDVLNFSTIDRDLFGNSVLVQRRSVPKISVRSICDRFAVNTIRAARQVLNAAPALWCWLDDLTDEYAEAGTILGIYKQFSITLDQPSTATVNLEVEEV